MKYSEIKLPSNIKFGFFFCLIFLLLGIFFLFSGSSGYSLTFFGLAIIFLVLTLIRPDFLLPLNKMWMAFGFILGTIVSPIILGLIFYGLFTPIALFMRLIGRDELNLDLKTSESYWKTKIKNPTIENSFKNQF